MTGDLMHEPAAADLEVLKPREMAALMAGSAAAAFSTMSAPGPMHFALSMAGIGCSGSFLIMVFSRLIRDVRNRG